MIWQKIGLARSKILGIKVRMPDLRKGTSTVKIFSEGLEEGSEEAKVAI